MNKRMVPGTGKPGKGEVFTNPYTMIDSLLRKERKERKEVSEF